MATKIVSKVWYDSQEDPSVTVYDTTDREFVIYSYSPDEQVYYHQYNEEGFLLLDKDYVPKKIRKLLKKSLRRAKNEEDLNTAAVVTANNILAVDKETQSLVLDYLEIARDNE